MPAPLAPCPSCQRHVRTDAPACPFCASALDDTFRGSARRPALPAARLGRAAIFAFGSAAIASTSGCYDAHERGTPRDPVPVDASMDTGIALLYGTPPDMPDAAPIARDAGVDSATIAAYGTPPIDDDAGASGPEYGAPPDDDAGAQQALYGGASADYGGPPADD